MWEGGGYEGQLLVKGIGGGGYFDSREYVDSRRYVDFRGYVEIC